MGGQWLIPTDDTAMKVFILKSVLFNRAPPPVSYVTHLSTHSMKACHLALTTAIAASVPADNTRHPSVVYSEQKHHRSGLSVKLGSKTGTAFGNGLK